jgi:hypothetical protein
MTQKKYEWIAKIADVMNPMGALVCEAFQKSPAAAVHASMRDALFLAAWKKAIDPDAKVSVKFPTQAALQNSLHEIIRLAVQVVGHHGSGDHDPMIGRLQISNSIRTDKTDHVYAENDEMRLREEVLYFFGTVSAFKSLRTVSEKMRSFEYLCAVVGQKDELLSLTVGEHLGSQMRSFFEYLCSLHYFQSNIRQSERLSRLIEIEEQLQELCGQIESLPFDTGQNATLICRSPQHSSSSAGSGSVCFLPSAFSCSDGDNADTIAAKIGVHLDAGVNSFYFIDSFHHRLRWMERLCRVRQNSRFEALRAEPLRRQAVLESRSGRHRVFILSSSTLDFLHAVSESRVFSTLSIPVQEMIHTALEVDSVRRSEGWGLPPAFDFVNLVESIAVHAHHLNSRRILPTLTDASVCKFLDAILLRQEIDSQQLYQLLID